jgi:hypothetical protein
MHPLCAQFSWATSYSPTHLARAVPSGLRGLTSVFGMGTGGTPSLESPKIDATRRKQDGDFRRSRGGITYSAGWRILTGFHNYSLSTIDFMVKPNGLLVTVSFASYPASTSVLSTW